jgi:hypothetical protein
MTFLFGSVATISRLGRPSGKETLARLEGFIVGQKRASSSSAIGIDVDLHLKPLASRALLFFPTYLR